MSTCTALAESIRSDIRRSVIWIHWTSSCFELIAHSQALRRAPLPLRALVSLLPRAADIGNSPILKALASKDSDLSTALEEADDC